MHRTAPRSIVPLLLALGAASAATSEPTSEPTPPNLLVIMTDEHNFRTLGCYRAGLPPEQALMWGDAVVSTPHIDRLADEGALCTSYYATSPVCSPSRAAFVTGKYPQNIGVIANNRPMNSEVVTFAAALAARGYATGYAGKWHLDGDAKPGWAPERRFGFEDNRFLFNRGHWKKLLLTDDGPRVGPKNQKGKPGYGVDGADDKTFTTDFLTDRTIEFVRAHRDEPFCFMVSLPDPHGPDTVRAPYDAMFADREFRRPRTFDVDPERLPSWAQPQPMKGGLSQSKYYGMVKCVDDNVGRILAELELLGLADDTIVVFTSDHGDLRGEHHRQNKGVPFEGSARIPFLVRAPGRVPARTVVDVALGSVDFTPTILALMDVDGPTGMEGRDASGYLTGDRPGEWADVTFVRSAGMSAAGWLMAVTERFKLIVSSQDDRWLFDLVSDPDEQRNFAYEESHRRVIVDLGGALDDYGQRFADPRVDEVNVRSSIDRAMRRD